MRSNKIIAHLSNNNDISRNDNVTVTDVDGVIKLINKGNVLIKFYSSMCHHCTTMGPAWTKLINTPQESDTQYTIISIESEFLGNPKISALLSKLKIHISGFPMIVFVSHNKSIINYEGPRTALDMNNFITKHTNKSMAKKQTGGNRKKYASKRHNTIHTRHRHTRRVKKSKRGGCGCGGI